MVSLLNSSRTLSGINGDLLNCLAFKEVLKNNTININEINLFIVNRYILYKLGLAGVLKFNYTAFEITVPEICRDLLNFNFWSALSSEYSFVKKL